ncbi:FAD/NAD(P)-binding domain-containing protein [Rhodotorula sp. JG-1b]|nr:FAD/NAD(P)-binding domain-containing protein [Rhodotorula sp. JG-1b]
MTGEYKNIVVVGLGLAAAEAVKALLPKLPADHRIVAVAENEGYWPIASLRAAVVPGWEDKPVASVDPLVPRGTQHILLKGTSVVELKEHSVVIDKSHPELGTEIPFEYCIVATGSDYPWPCRPRKGASIDEIKSDFRTLQAQVESSSSILVVGGGPVGIEFAGEVAAHYNGKAGRAKKQGITIVHAQETYLTEPGWKDGFNSSIRSQLDGLGVKTIFGAKVDDIPDKTGQLAGGTQDFALSNGETVTADFVFLAIGNSPNTQLVQKLDPEAINNSNKLVKVKPSFQLERHPALFAIGDIADVAESKIYAHAKNHGAIVAANILSLINSSSSSSAAEPSLKAYKPGPMLMIVSIGPKGGAGQLFGMVVGSWLAWLAKSRTLFVDAFQKTYA